MLTVMNYDMNCKNNNQSTNISFGCIDTSTGAFQEGYTNKEGKQKFKKAPWWKAIFAKEPTETELIGIYKAQCSYIWSDKYRDCGYLRMYRTFNPFTGKTLKVFGKHDRYGTIQYDVESYLKCGMFVEI